MKKILIIVTVGVLLIVGFLGLTYSNPVNTNEPIKIGALLCLTGSCANWGEAAKQGAEMAIEEINAKGGVLGQALVLVAEDSKEETVAQAISGYQKLLRDDIHYLIGPTWTPAGLAIAPLAAKDSDVIITSPSLGVKEFNEAGDNIFNLWPHDEIATRYLAKFAVAQGWKRVALISSTQAWEQTQGEAFEDEFKKLGGTVVIKIEPLETVTDLKTEALKIKRSNPDVAMFTNFTHMSIAAKELKRLGYAGPKLSILMDDTRVQASEGGLEGTIYAQSPEAKKSFTDNFVKKYNTKPDTSADVAYDVIYFYAAAIEQAGTTDVQKVKTVMNKLKTFDGASGHLVFDGKGGVLRDPVLWQVKDSKFVRYEE